MKHLKTWLPLVVLIICIVPLVGCIVSKSTYETLQHDSQVIQEENTSLKAELEFSNLKANNLQAELDQIKAVFPPRYFDSHNELDDWVKANLKSAEGDNLLGKHLDLQKKALADGYIWSVQYDYKTGTVGGCVVAGDNIYGVWLDGYTEWWGLR